MSIESVLGVVSVAKVAVDASKKALDIANQLKNVELKEAILDLKEELIRLREENISLKENLSKQEKYNMHFKENFDYYVNIKEDGTEEGSYCTVCWDTDRKAVRLHQGAYNKYCDACKIKARKP